MKAWQGHRRRRLALALLAASSCFALAVGLCRHVEVPTILGAFLLGAAAMGFADEWAEGWRP